ncbi:hypothetical protein Drorol1_Dr00013320 [Drosera rotundifolia]
MKGIPFLSSCSVVFFFIIVIGIKITSATVSLQLLSLLSLKSSLKDPSSTLTDWDVNPVFSKPGHEHHYPSWCSWSGVKCDHRTFQVTSLDLSFHNLSGTIPPEIKYLKQLNHLNLSGNAFEGPLPSSIFELSELRTLDISRNNFNSTFPIGISNLNSLRYLNSYSNSFTGPLPQNLAELQYLEYLNLGGSYFEGSIPAIYGRIPRLNVLYLAGNSLNGSIPPELGHLAHLQHVEIGYNQLSGSIPGELSKLSNLQYLDISNSNLSGSLPPELGNLTALKTLLLFKNRITGSIPDTFSGLLSLQILDISDNQLTGSIPEAISSMKDLTLISLMDNNLTGHIPEGIGDLPDLQILHLWNNSLTGTLPSRLGFNNKLQKLDVSSNHLSGPLPSAICSGNNLIKLILFSNNFSGQLPRQLGNCTALNRVRIQHNSFNGTIPFRINHLPNLTFMDLSSNNLNGDIPSDLAYSPALEYLNISANNLTSHLPRRIWSAPSLQIFSANAAGLIGEIPNFFGCKELYRLELSDNSLTASIPFDIGHCEKLATLTLARNSLSGIIPWEISTLQSITAVDLSHNNLSGTIPSSFANCTTLEIFNVSFNDLSGQIDEFANLEASSFEGNGGLCGRLIGKLCIPSSPEYGGRDEVTAAEGWRSAGAIVWITAAAFGVGLLVLVAGSRCFDRTGLSAPNRKSPGPWKLTAFQRLNFTADDVVESLSSSDGILGMGSTGAVYKAVMPRGEIIAVKKLWGKNKATVRMRSGGAVLAEVEVLGNVRHRNIVRLLGCCSNEETTLLLYEYMPNGSVDGLLHRKKSKEDNVVVGGVGGEVIDWVTRHKIVLGVAQGICYLHHDCDPVIVHRDLKPSNILLDGEMEARVADFGVAKLIQSDESMSVIAGSYGYIAPEYAYTLQVDEKSDIYSFGVVLLEILSGKRSVEPEFGDGNSIVEWVRTKVKTKEGVDEILDENAGASCALVREEMILVLGVALLCTSRNPADRPSMRDVVSMLLEAMPKRKQLDGDHDDRHDHVIEISCGHNGCDAKTQIGEKTQEKYVIV